MKTEPNPKTTRRRELTRILPMYAAACVVLLCGIGAYLSTYDGFGAGAAVAIIAGVGVSIFARVRQWRQDTMFGVMAALVVAIISWLSVTGGGSAAQMLGVLGDRNNFPGVLLAWFVILYSFAMVTDEVIIFAIVPSIALLGTVASDNLNTDVVVYFLGLLVSAVFLLVYENMLSRGVEETPVAPSARFTAPTGIRTSLLMTSMVVAMAMLVGLAASRPLTYLGETLRTHTPEMPIPPASQFASDMSARYINEMDLSGAPPHLSDRVAMRVESPQPFYWRGKVFGIYTGYSWTATNRSQAGHRYSADDTDVTDLLMSGTGTRARVPVLQSIEMENGAINGMALAAAEPVLFYPLSWRRRSQDGRMEPRHGLQPDDLYSSRSPRRYTALSLVSEATPEQLRRAGTDYPLALKFTNTQLGGDPSPVRKAIAERITAGATNEYDRVKALETYLRDSFEYTLSPPRTPSSVDAVTYFLTRTKQGYCEIFASSLAVLCREIGIPARLATGFAPGEWDAGGGRSGKDYAKGLSLADNVRQAVESAGQYGVATVRERDLHAWTEVYFPHYGWIAFDPTSSREPAPSWSNSVAARLRDLVRGVTAHANGAGLVMLGIALVAMFLLKTYGLDTLRSSSWWISSPLARRRLPARARWDILYTHAHRRLRRRAGLKAPHQTPYEYAAVVRAVVPGDAAAAFDALTDYYVRRAFQPADPSEADVLILLGLEKDLKIALRARHPAGTPAHQSP